MSDEDQKISIPEDFPGTGDGGESGKVNPEVEKDPEVIAEEKKLRLSELRWKRYIVSFKGIAIGLQTFKAEAVSLISGIGTLVVGWYQIRKWVAVGKAESKAVGKAEGRMVGRAAERAERKEDRREARDIRGDEQHIGSGYGSGAGRLGGSVKALPAEVKKLKALSQKQVQMAPTPGIELVTAAVDVAKPPIFDMMNSLTVGLPAIFLWATAKAWIKRKKKLTEDGGRRNGD